MTHYDEALTAIRNGKYILLYDCERREEETDVVLAAEHVTPQLIYEARHNAGGLICVAIRSDTAQKLGLPFMTDILESASERFPALSKVTSVDTPYGDKPAFSISINHRNTFTGITDNDRALTIRELAKLVRKAKDSNLKEDALRREFGANFRSPGHVHILIAEENLLNSRRGHTEFSIALAEIADITPVMMVCEMLDNHAGKALPKDAALRYARSHGLPFLEGKDVLQAYHNFKTAPSNGGIFT